MTPAHLLTEIENKVHKIPFKFLESVTVCKPMEMILAKGDRLQLKANSKSDDGKELVNGELVTVRGIKSDGRIELADGE